MGQYYRAALLSQDKKGKLEVFSPYDYKSGAKLMEHSWIGNNYINAVISHLNEHPMKVYWMGDYADEHPLCKRIWDRKRFSKEIPGFESLNKSTKGMAFINHSRHCYLSLDDYIKSNTCDVSCINPLSLLTVCGNGRGSGDYFGAYADDVGSWAGDVIEYASAEKAEKLGYGLEEYFFWEE